MARARLSTSLACLLGALSLGACGGSAYTNAGSPTHQRLAARTAPTPAQIACTQPARSAMSTYLHVPSTTISQSGSIANNDMPQCRFRARLARGRTVDAVVNVYNGPQPYFLLLRTENEDAQGWPQLSHPPPAAVMHLGLEADWFPQYPQLMTTDGLRLITVAVTWSRQHQRDEEALAIAMARPFLHTPHGRAADKVALDYP